MSIENGYVTLAELKTFLGVDSTDKDVFFESCIEQASRFLDDSLGAEQYLKTITNEQVDVYSESPNGFRLEKYSNYITGPAKNLSITEIENDGVVLNTDEYKVIKGNIYKRDGVFSVVFNGVKITGTVGYTDATAPKDLKRATLEIAGMFSHDYKRKIISEGVDVQESINEIPEFVEKYIAQNSRIV